MIKASKSLVSHGNSIDAILGILALLEVIISNDGLVEEAEQLRTNSNVQKAAV